MAALETKDIVTINLKYSSAARPLRTLAFAQLVAKVMYLAGGPLGAHKLAKRIASALAVPRVADQSVVEGLTFLHEIGATRKSGDRWDLTAEGREAISLDVATSQADLDGLLNRHFPKTIDRGALRNWFNEVAAHVFGKYGDEWVSSVCRGSRTGFSRIESLAKLSSASTRKYKLATHSGSLNDGFLRFLSSEDLADQQYLMALGQAMFSARLVAAGVGADPITLEEFRGARIILDTNLLFAIALEDHRVAKAVRALGRALQRIGATPVYLRPTMEEYERALSGVRAEVLRLVQLFPSDVVAEAQNDFLATALARSCRTPEDFERFFQSLQHVPDSIGAGTNLGLHEDDETEKAMTSAYNDSQLKNRIQHFAYEKRPEWRKKEKSPRSLDHDAALIHIAEHDRSLGEKCWVLSLDRSLQSCALERAGPHSIQTVLSVDALVEILAVNEAGPDIDPSEYAPLLARMIIHECAPPANTYTLEDLKWLRTINEAAAELSSDDTREIANVIARARVQGKQVSDPQLQLSVNRMFQAKREAGERALSEARERAQGAEALVGEEREARERAEAEVVRLTKESIIRGARRTLALQLSWRLGVAAALSFGFWTLGRRVVPEGDLQGIVSYIGSLGSLVAAGWGLAPSAWKVYQTRVAGAEREARALIRDRRQE